MSSITKLGGFPAREDGFTLIEMMIVITVIAILATIGLPQFTKVRDKAEFTEVRAEMRNLQTALEMYYSTHQEYPAGEDLKNELESIDSGVVEAYQVEGEDKGYSTTDSGYKWEYTHAGKTITIKEDGTFKVSESESE